jgi:hypothetical protein
VQGHPEAGGGLARAMAPRGLGATKHTLHASLALSAHGGRGLLKKGACRVWPSGRISRCYTRFLYPGVVPRLVESQ